MQAARVGGRGKWELTIVTALVGAVSKHEMQHGIKITYLMEGMYSLGVKPSLSLLLKHLLNVFFLEGIRAISQIPKSHLLEQRKEVNDSPWEFKRTKAKREHVPVCGIGNNVCRE